MKIDALLSRATLHHFDPVPTVAADAAATVPHKCEILHFGPPARFQQREHGGADVAGPVGHAADEQPAEDVVEGPGQESWVRRC